MAKRKTIALMRPHRQWPSLNARTDIVAMVALWAIVLLLLWIDFSIRHQ